MSFAYYERTTICIKTIVREYRMEKMTENDKIVADRCPCCGDEMEADDKRFWMHKKEPDRCMPELAAFSIQEPSYD